MRNPPVDYINPKIVTRFINSKQREMQRVLTWSSLALSVAEAGVFSKFDAGQGDEATKTEASVASQYTWQDKAVNDDL